MTHSVSIINLDKKAAPAVLAGMFGVSTPLIHQYRQEGKLPADKETSYRDCIVHYISWHKKKHNVKVSNIVEQKLAQDIRNGEAKEELQWLEIKKRREELIDVEELDQLFSPIFELVRTSMVNLAREHPDIQKKVDHILDTWSSLGENIVLEASRDSNSFSSEKVRSKEDSIEMVEKRKKTAEDILDEELEGYESGDF